jgi:outer membrane biosynthesis protein TonB
VSSEFTEKAQRLKSQIEQSERGLAGLRDKLRGIDAELDALHEEKSRYDLLSKACESLQKLDELGAAGLFWDEQSTPEERQRYFKRAHGNVTEFEARLARVQERRQALVQSVGDQYSVLDDLQYDLKDVEAAEESRRNEWLVEREASMLPYRSLIMPWARGCEEDQRFQRSLAASVLLCVLTGWLFSIIDLPIPERAEVIKVPERVAKLVREEMRRPPAPVEEETVVVDEDIPEPEPEVPEEQPPEQLQESAQQGMVAEAEEPKPREAVKSKGILAFRESFANRANLRPIVDLGSAEKFSNAGDAAVGRPQRSMVTSLAPGSSGGINLASISRDVGGGGGGGGMAGVQATRVASSIGGNGSGNGRPLSGGASAGRTDEEIQIVFDRYKAALYRLYNRELRKDPTLRGQLVLRMTIEPDGSVSFCTLQSTDMNAPTLTEQIVDRVRNFDFGAKEDIVAVTIVYPIDFLPAA